jgi:hypothetical protein
MANGLLLDFDFNNFDRDSQGVRQLTWGGQNLNGCNNFPSESENCFF